MFWNMKPNFGIRNADCGLLISSLLYFFGSAEMNNEGIRFRAHNPNSEIIQKKVQMLISHFIRWRNQWSR
jgi:hypothetical protein